MERPRYTYFPDLAREVAPPDAGILSRTVERMNGIDLVLFGFAQGEELEEHTSSRPAIIHILSGQADLTIAGDSIDGVPGTWLRMPADTKHAVVARTPVVMALYLLPRPGA